MTSIRRQVACVAVFFIVWTLILLRGLWADPGSLLPADAGDPVLNVAILQWNATSVPLTSAWWNFPAFFPVRGITAFTEHLLAPSVVSSPVIWLTGNPVLAYNIVFLLSFFASGIAMWALVYWLTRSMLAGLVAGIAFAFSPYRGVHLSHVQMLWTIGMPLALLGGHWFLATGRWRALTVFAIGWLATSLGNSYFAVFFGLYLGCWLCWFASTSAVRRRGAVLLGTLVLTSLPLAVLFLNYDAIHDAYGLTRPLTEIRTFSADLMSLMTSSPHATVAAGWTQSQPIEGALYPGLAVAVLAAAGGYITLRGRRDQAVTTKTPLIAFLLASVFVCAAIAAAMYGPTQTQVLGLVISLSSPEKPLSVALLLAVIAVASLPSMRAAFRRRDVLVFYLASVPWTFLLAMGPEPTFAGTPILYGTPYRWLIEIPAMQGIRVPSRFWMLGTLALAVSAGLATPMLRTRVALLRRSSNWGPVLALLLAEGWLTIPVVAAPEQHAGNMQERDAVVLELPIGDIASDAAAQLRAVVDGYETVNGYSGYFPPHYRAMVRGLRGRAGGRAGETPTSCARCWQRVHYLSLFQDTTPRELRGSGHISQRVSLLQRASTRSIDSPRFRKPRLLT